MCPFFIFLSESCSANIRKFEVPYWILFARFHWLKPHCALPKCFQIRVGCILSSSNGPSCIKYFPIKTNGILFVPWNLKCHFIKIINLNNLLLFKINRFFPMIQNEILFRHFVFIFWFTILVFYEKFACADVSFQTISFRDNVSLTFITQNYISCLSKWPRNEITAAMSFI